MESYKNKIAFYRFYILVLHNWYICSEVIFILIFVFSVWKWPSNGRNVTDSIYNDQVYFEHYCLLNYFYFETVLHNKNQSFTELNQTYAKTYIKQSVIAMKSVKRKPNSGCEDEYSELLWSAQHQP